MKLKCLYYGVAVLYLKHLVNDLMLSEPQRQANIADLKRGLSGLWKSILFNFLLIISWKAPTTQDKVETSQENITWKEKNIAVLEQWYRLGSSTFFRKGPDNKYLGLCRPEGIYCI